MLSYKESFSSLPPPHPPPKRKEKLVQPIIYRLLSQENYLTKVKNNTLSKVVFCYLYFNIYLLCYSRIVFLIDLIYKE